MSGARASSLLLVMALVACGGGGGSPTSPGSTTAPAASTTTSTSGSASAQAIAGDVGELVGSATISLLGHAVSGAVTTTAVATGRQFLAVTRLSLTCPAGGTARMEFDADGSRAVPAGTAIVFTDCTATGRRSAVSVAVNGTVTTTGRYTAETPDVPVVGETAAAPGGTLAIDGRVRGDGGYIGLIGGQSYNVGCTDGIGCIFTGPPDTLPPPNPTTPSPTVSTFSGSLSGNWSGSCGGEGVSGTFTVSVSGSGSVTGSFSGETSGSISGSVSGSGVLSASGSAGVASWGGTITRSGSVLSGSGSWSGAIEGESCSGGWSGSGAASS